MALDYIKKFPKEKKEKKPEPYKFTPKEEKEIQEYYDKTYGGRYTGD